MKETQSAGLAITALRLRAFARRVLCALLVMTLVVNGLPIATLSEVLDADDRLELVSSPVEPSADELGAFALNDQDSDGEDQPFDMDSASVEAPVDEMKAFELGEPEAILGEPVEQAGFRFSLADRAVCLSEILDAVGLGDDVRAIIGVGLFDPENTDLLRIEQVGEDYLIQALSDFDEVALCVDAEDGQYIILLIDGEVGEGEAPEPTEEPALYPTQGFEGSLTGVHVSVEVPEGALPMGTEMRVTEVLDKSTIANIENAVVEDDVEVKRVHAVDISFWMGGSGSSRCSPFPS